jgi:hypothetical protein
MTRRDLRYAARAKRAGARHTIKTVREARRHGVPLSWAFALVEQESGGKNVFGADRGSILAHQKVTKKRVAELLDYVRHGGVSNGVGLTQLTWVPLIEEANKAGGAHLPKHQLHVGLKFFRETTGGEFDRLAWKYNGDPAYQVQIKAKQRRWHKVLTKGGE